MNDYSIKQYYEDPLSFCCRYEIIHFSYTLTEYFPENFEKNEKKVYLCENKGLHDDCCVV